MEFTGKIIFMGKEEKVGQNQLPKVTFVVEETEGQYPNSMAIDMFNDKIDLIKSHKVGDIVKLGVNFRSREYNGKYFNSISARKVEAGNGSDTPKESGESKAKKTAKNNDDDLPF